MAVLSQIQIRRDTAANWSSSNPTLLVGEQGLETDTGYVKVGNGTSAWNSLPYTVTTVSTTAPISGQGYANPNIPAFPGGGVYLPAGYVIQQGGILYSKNASSVTAGSFSTSNWTAIGGTSSSPLTINPTAVTSGSPTLSTTMQTEVTCSTGGITVNLPSASSSNAGEFLAVEKTDSTLYAVTISGPIRSSSTATLSLRLTHETIGFVADANGYWWPAWSHKPLGALYTQFQPGYGPISQAVGGLVQGGSSAATTTTNVYGRRYIVSEDTTLTATSIAAYAYLVSGSSTSEHASLAIYDTGETNGAGTRTLLAYTPVSGATAIPLQTGATTWASLPYNQPANASLVFVSGGVGVTGTTSLSLSAGQHIDMAFQSDATAVTLGVDSAPSNAAAWQFPPGALPCIGGAAPIAAWSYTVTTTTLVAWTSSTLGSGILGEPAYSGGATTVKFAATTGRPYQIVGAF